jgi:hypothetical protein
MRVIPFPSRREISQEKDWLIELEAALNGTSSGPDADSWRELRRDVRALAPPMAPEFERELSQRIAQAGARPAPKHSHRRSGWLRPPGRPALASLAAVCVVIAVALIIAPWHPGGHVVERFPSSSPLADSAGRASGEIARSPKFGTNAPESSAASASSASATAPAAAPGRVQQLAASIALSATPSEVQRIADSVSRLAVSDGGFVQSSHVDAERATGEANLTLSLPSSSLSAALAGLARLAPVHAESQSLQDITGSYDAARGRLADANAERRALLHALAAASTAGQIDSLRERLAQVRGTIVRAHSALQTVSRRAANAEVEVTVLGDTHARSEGLTPRRALHDAGRVLLVTLAVLLITAAVLVPLAIVLAVLTIGWRAWRRYRRELVLDAGN